MRVCPRCSAIYGRDANVCGIDGTGLVERSDDPFIGQTIGRYRIVDRLGAGAMGCVYRATHTAFPAQYAIKILYGDMAANRAVAQRFRREADTITKLRHPNIVSIVEFGTTPGGLNLMVMELVEGQALSGAFEAKERFSPPRAANIVRQVASGLLATHDHGFVHRDLTPGNVLLVKRGYNEHVKLFYFGVVGVTDAEADEPKLTKTGFTLGTPAYMAPEQVEGSGVGPEADLYSLGVCLFEMVAGRPPFEGPVQKILADKMLKPPPALPPSGGLEALAARLLARHPKHRMSSAREVIAAIDRLGLVATPAPTSGPDESVTTESGRPSDPVQDARHLHGGQKVAGFTLQNQLGAGGFGSVWAAKSEDGKDVALKILHARYLARKEGARGPSVPDRFLAEARLLQKLTHPGLVQIEQVIEDREAHVVAYAMERLHGGDLAAKAPEMTLATLLDVFISTADTLAFLHANNVVHRDVKRSNIYITDPNSEGGMRTKLLDFGVAKELHAQAILENTADESFLGTVGSMAPESLDTTSRAPVTPAVDQWSLGVALYECLTGRAPFEDRSVVYLMKKIQGAPPERLVLLDRFGFKEPPGPLATVIGRCLNKAPGDRFGSMSELVEALRFARSQLTTDVLQLSREELDLTRDDGKRPSGIWDAVLTPGSGLVPNAPPIPGTPADPTAPAGVPVAPPIAMGQPIDVSTGGQAPSTTLDHDPPFAFVGVAPVGPATALPRGDTSPNGPPGNDFASEYEAPARQVDISPMPFAGASVTALDDDPSVPVIEFPPTTKSDGDGVTLDASDKTLDAADSTHPPFPVLLSPEVIEHLPAPPAGEVSAKQPSNGTPAPVPAAPLPVEITTPASPPDTADQSLNRRPLVGGAEIIQLQIEDEVAGPTVLDTRLNEAAVAEVKAFAEAQEAAAQKAQNDQEHAATVPEPRQEAAMSSMAAALPTTPAPPPEMAEATSSTGDLIAQTKGSGYGQYIFGLVCLAVGLALGWFLNS